MADKLANVPDMPSSPSRNAYAVTKSDTVELDPLPKALWIGTGGDVVVQTIDGGGVVTFKNVPSGTLLPVRAKLVKAATTASDIVGLG